MSAEETVEMGVDEISLLLAEDDDQTMVSSFDYVGTVVEFQQAVHIFPTRFQHGVYETDDYGVSDNTSGHPASHSWTDDVVEPGEKFLVLFDTESGEVTHLFRHA